MEVSSPVLFPSVVQSEPTAVDSRFRPHWSYALHFFAHVPGHQVHMKLDTLKKHAVAADRAALQGCEVTSW